MLKNYVHKVFVVSLLLLSISIQSQIRIKGKVIDENTRENLYNVSIFVKGALIGTVSDSEGLFEIVLSKNISKLDTLTFSRIDYQKVSFLINDLTLKFQTILMSKKTIKLESVNLKSKVNKQLYLKYKKLAPMKKAVFAFASIINNEKLHVFGGDTSTFENTLGQAFERANASKLSPSFRDVQRFWNPSFSRRDFENQIQIYDFKKDKWESHILKSKKRAYHHVAYFKNEYYLFGGKRISGFKKDEYLENEVELINLNNSKISTDNVNPHMAVNFAASTYKEYFFTIGGSLKIKKNGKKVFNENIHAYNFKTGYWYNLGKIPEPMESSAVNLGKNIFLVGGYNGKVLDRISMFNTENGVWKNIGRLFYPIEFPALTSHKKKIYIFDSGKIIVLNTSNFTLSQYEVKIYLKRSSMHIYDNKLFILGGYQENQYSKINSNLLYSIDLLEFDKTKPTLFKEL